MLFGGVRLLRALVVAMSASLSAADELGYAWHLVRAVVLVYFLF